MDDSVTKFFYERGWNGINVEPNTELYVALENDRPRDINVNVGVSDAEGMLRFRNYRKHPGLSTFSDQIMAIHAVEDLPYEDSEVAVVTLEQLLTENDVERIDFMKIDVEGHELRVISGNDWRRFRPRVLVVEGGAVDEWEPVLGAAAYRREFFDGLNYYYLADEEVGSLTIMNYASRVLSRGVSNHRDACALRELRSDIAALRSQLGVTAEPPATTAGLTSKVRRLIRR